MQAAQSFRDSPPSLQCCSIYFFFNIQDPLSLEPGARVFLLIPSGRPRQSVYIHTIINKFHTGTFGLRHDLTYVKQVTCVRAFLLYFFVKVFFFAFLCRNFFLLFSFVRLFFIFPTYLLSHGPPLMKPYVSRPVTYTYIIQLTPQRGFSVTDYIKYYAYVYYLLSLD